MALEPRRAQGIDDDVAWHALPQRPAQRLSAEQVDHHGQEQPAFAAVDVVDVARPALVGFTHGKLPISHLSYNLWTFV